MAVRAMHEVDLGIRDVKVYTNDADLATGDTTAAVRIPNYSDKSVQVTGTFGGATVTMQGSNDNTNWSTLHKTDLSSLAFTSEGLFTILENPVYIRASAAGGAGSALTVVICGSTSRSN